MLPVVPCLRQVPGGLAGAGEATVCACLLPWRVGLGCEAEGSGVMRPRLVGVALSEENLPEAVERVGL